MLTQRLAAHIAPLLHRCGASAGASYERYHTPGFGSKFGTVPRWTMDTVTPRYPGRPLVSPKSFILKLDLSPQITRCTEQILWVLVIRYSRTWYWT